MIQLKSTQSFWFGSEDEKSRLSIQPEQGLDHRHDLGVPVAARPMDRFEASRRLSAVILILHQVGVLVEVTAKVNNILHLAEETEVSHGDVWAGDEIMRGEVIVQLGEQSSLRAFGLLDEEYVLFFGGALLSFESEHGDNLFAVRWAELISVEVGPLVDLVQLLVIARVELASFVREELG